MKKAFTIVELLVAVALMAILMAISGLVFAAAVKAYRTAGAASEIASKLQVMTQQLDDDLRGLRKDGEFIVVWAPSPELDRNNPVPTIVDKNGDKIPDRYLSFDRLMFFADGDYQSYNAQKTFNSDVNGDGTINDNDTAMAHSNLARICYSFGRNADDVQAPYEPSPNKRLFCRTQHLYATHTESVTNFPTGAPLRLFPVVTPWDAVLFEQYNYSYEYQTMTMDEWTALSRLRYGIWDYLTVQQQQNFQTKIEMLSCVVDLTMSYQVLRSDMTPEDIVSTVKQGGPKIDLDDFDTLPQLFMQGVGQFHVQIWRMDLNRWFPEIDPDGDGIYNEGTSFDTGRTDYWLTGNLLNVTQYTGKWTDFTEYFDRYVGPALKFTFTLYDSNGVFKDGKTFTHVVYLND